MYHQRLKSLDQTPARDHDSVFKWIWANKPLDDGEFDWIFHPDDFVSMIPPRRNRFESFIQSHIDSQPNSFLKVCLSVLYTIIPFPWLVPSLIIYFPTEILQCWKAGTWVTRPITRVLFHGTDQNRRPASRCFHCCTSPLYSCYSFSLDLDE